MIIVEGNKKQQKHCVFDKQIKAVFYENKKVIVLLGDGLSLEWYCDNEQLFYDLIRCIRSEMDVMDVIVKFHENTYTIIKIKEGDKFETEEEKDVDGEFI